MAENISESEAAKATLSEQEAPAEEPVISAPGENGANGDELDELDEIVEEIQDGRMNFADAAKNTWTLDLLLYREDKANNFFVTYREVAELVFKRLGVEEGMLVSVDTSPYKKITLELDNCQQFGNLNITQSLSVRSGLWTRPLQAPEKDRVVNIKWAPMKLPGQDIEAVLKWFSEITSGVENVGLRDTGNEDWTALMEGVKTSERTCRMKIRTNIPSLIMVRGNQKIRKLEE